MKDSGHNGKAATAILDGDISETKKKKGQEKGATKDPLLHRNKALKEKNQKTRLQSRTGNRTSVSSRYVRKKVASPTRCTSSRQNVGEVPEERRGRKGTRIREDPSLLCRSGR